METTEFVGRKVLTCPRCWGEMSPPRLALSRLDNVTHVCPDCGVAEALEQYTNGEVYNWKEEK